MFISIGILFILACVLFFIIGAAVANNGRTETERAFENKIATLVKTYNDDTKALYEERDQLAERNKELDNKIKSINSELISFKTKYKSAMVDVEKLKETQCTKKCAEKKAEEKKSEANKEPTKKGRKAKTK